MFVPKETLKEDIIYTVKITKSVGLEGSDEKTQDDCVFNFQVEKQQTEFYKFFYFSDVLFNFTSNVTPALNVNVGDNYKNAPVKVDVYKYNSDEDFYKNISKAYELPYWCNINKSELDFDMSGLSKISSFDKKIEEHKGNYWYMDFVIFPEELSQGYYLINVTCNDGKQYRTHVQINDMATSVTVCTNKTLVWVNSTNTEKPVNGAKVEFIGSETAVTGDDGVAVIDKPLNMTGNYYCFKVSSDSSPALYTFNYNNNYYYDSSYDPSKGSPHDKYWSYVYLDRGIYLPDDTVNIWGLVKPRDQEEAPSKLELQLFRYDYSYYSGFYYDGEFGVIENKEVVLNKFGTFKSEISYSNLNSGTYAIKVIYNGQVIKENMFEIKQYTKPAYRISVDMGKNYSFAWDKIVADINASFFEGSPVAGLELNYSYYNGASYMSSNVVCDENGNANVRMDFQNPHKYWRPQNISLNVRNAKAEEEEVRAESGIMVFPSDTMIIAKEKLEGDKGKVSVETNLIDKNKLDDLEYFYDHETYKGSSVDMDLKAYVYENYYEAVERGEYYDFINKRTHKLYYYNSVRKLTEEIDFKTVGGKGSFDFEFKKDSKIQRYYDVEIRGKDSRGEEIVETVYVYDWSSYHRYGFDSEGYALKNQSGKEEFKTDDKIVMAIKNNNQDILEDAKGKSLFVLLRNGVVDYTVTDSTVYEASFNEKYIPNVYVKALYFNGSLIYNTGMIEAHFDSSERKLQVDVTSDKVQYKPGETASLNVSVKDADGRPCSAEVNLSIVDEAVFALRDQSVDTLSSLYFISVSSGVLEEFVSHKTPDQYYNPMAECGEGGDSGIRSFFKDTAFFDSIVTGNDGKGKASFKLPDNLTSWRITYQAVTEDLKAGSGNVNITSRLPFFVDVIYNDTFMEGDTPVITMRSFGTGLKQGSEVSYSVVLESPDGQKKTLTTKGKANATAWVELGRLKEGKYNVTVSAQADSLKDGIKREFQVVKNMLSASKTDFYKLEEGLKPQGGESLTTLVFCNSGSSEVYNSLFSLLYTWGERVDQKLARKIAAETLKKYYQQELPFYTEEEFDFTKYQLYDGGIALLSYDSSDVTLTAKICSICPEMFDTNALKAYFYSVLGNSASTPEQVFTAYYGLAALKEPVLIDAYNLLSTPDLDVKDKIYLGLALAELGDYDKASEIYREIVSSYGEKADPNYLVNIGKDRDDVLENTALCSILAFKLQKEEASGMFGYVKSSNPSELLLNLEKLIYITNSIPDVQNKGKFTYTLDGEKKAVTIDKAEQFKLLLTKEKLDTLAFSDIEGDISVTSIYTGSPKELIGNDGNTLELLRMYTVDGTEKSSVKQSDLIKIVIEPKLNKLAPDGYYEITDILPAAFRHIPPRYYEYNENIRYPFEVDGQKIVYGFYYSAESGVIPKLVCYARAVCPGEYTCDNAFVKHYNSNVSGFSEQQKITVEK